MTGAPTDCPLCLAHDPPTIWRDARLRVISAGDADYPGFLRVVWNEHIREMTDLEPAARDHCLLVVFAVERALRDTLQPHKINVATIGNQVPHLHWHVIPRFEDDAHFPDPVWAARRRDGVPHAFDADRFRTRLMRVLGA